MFEAGFILEPIARIITRKRVGSRKEPFSVAQNGTRTPELEIAFLNRNKAQKPALIRYL
jgi:hypothetical protein